MNVRLVFILFVSIIFISVTVSSSSTTKKPTLKNKKVIDYTDQDVERLFEEWEENDEEKLPEDEKPNHMKKPKPIDMSKINMKNLDDIKKVNKRGQAIMMFVTVAGNPTRQETEKLTSLWQSSLFNANYELTRYILEDNQAIFMINDGSLAWEIKDFLIKQKECLEVKIDQDVYPGLYAKKSNDEKNDKKDKSDL